LALMEVGDFAGADANIDLLEEEASATGQARHMWHATLLRAARALHEGRFRDADSLAAGAGEIAASDEAARGALFMHRFARLRAEERGPELIALEPQMLAGISRWNDSEAYAHLMSATIRAVAGDLQAARSHLAGIPRRSVPERIRITRGVIA